MYFHIQYITIQWHSETHPVIEEEQSSADLQLSIFSNHYCNVQYMVFIGQDGYENV